MWHLKTKTGTFWIIPSEEDNSCLLGVEDEHLGKFKDAEDAAHHVHDQETGFALWDGKAYVKAPEHITEWQPGAPEDWE